jgi:hypothetical protein
MILEDKALLEKLRRIGALHAGATTPGERDAAANAPQLFPAGAEHGSFHGGFS